MHSMQWEPNRTEIMTHAQWTEQQNLIHYLSKGKGTIANNTVDAPLDCYWMVGDAIESIICKEMQKIFWHKVYIPKLDFLNKKATKICEKKMFKTIRCLIVWTMISDER